MGRITLITNDIWSDEALQELPDDTHIVLYFRLLLNESNNIAGYYKLNLRHLSSDLNRSAEETEKLLSYETPLWKYDRQTKQVLIPTYLKYNIVRSGNQLKAVSSLIRQLKVCDLHLDFLKAFNKYCGIGAVGLLDRSVLVDCYKIAQKDREAMQIIKSYI